MPRRATAIALIALFSLGLLSVRPVVAQTDKSATHTTGEVTALKEEVAELRKELAEERTTREKFGFKMEILKEKLEGWYLNTKTIGEWIDRYIVMVLTAVAVFAGGLGLVIRLFFRAEVQRVQALGDDMRRIRDEAGELMQGLHDSVAEASAITEELEQRMVQIDEDLERKEKEAVAAIDEERNRATKFIMEGLKDYEQSRYKAALESWERALEIDDQSPRAWNNKGAALWSLGRYEDALEAHEKAIELDPNYAPAWLNKGVALLNLGRQEESLEASERAIGLDPEGADARYNKACAHGFLGDKPAMLDALKMAIERDSKWKEKAKTDSAFEPYRSDADFQELVGEDQ